MEDYPSNNPRKQQRAETPTKKQVTAVVSDGVTVRKKSVSKKFAQAYFGGSAREAGQRAFWTVLLPRIKDLTRDYGIAMIDGVLFGEQARPTSSNSIGRVAYNSAFKGSQIIGQQSSPAPQISRRARAAHDFDEIVFDSRDKAQAVIDGLYTLLSQYGVATVGDLYDLCGITQEFTNENWGWTNLSGSGIAYAGGAYLLNLPNPEALKR